MELWTSVDCHFQDLPVCTSAGNVTRRLDRVGRPIFYVVRSLWARRTNGDRSRTRLFTDINFPLVVLRKLIQVPCSRERRAGGHFCRPRVFWLSFSVKSTLWSSLLSTYVLERRNNKLLRRLMLRLGGFVVWSEEKHNSVLPSEKRNGY